MRPIRLKFWMLKVLLAGLILGLFSWDLLRPGVFLMHDFTQVGRLAEMQRSLAAGEFPVQWSQNFGFGYGMPLFLFYGPLPFYFGAALMSFSISAITTMKLLFFFSGLIGAWGVYEWFRPRSRTAAWAAATVFVALPYRAVDIYVRGALNEVLAMGFLPWLLVTARISSRSWRWGVLTTAAVSAALLLTHNLTALIGIPVVSGLGLIWIGLYAQRRWKSWSAFISGHVLGLGLATFFVWPSLVENKFTQINQILGGYFDFRLHFLSHHQLLFEHWGFGGSQFGVDDGISFHWGTPSWLAVFIAAILLWRMLYSWWRNRRIRFQKITFLPLGFWWLSSLLLAAAISLFFTIGRSQPLWEVIPLLPLVQFPWRFLVVAGVLAALLVGEVVTQTRPTAFRWILAFSFLTLAFGQAPWHRGQERLRQPEQYYSSHPEYIQQELSHILPDFLPLNFDRSLPVVTENERITIHPGLLTFEQNKPQHLVARQSENIATTSTTITWNIADFPGWSYRVNNREVNPEILPDGRRQLTTSTPVETIQAQFNPTPTRLAAWRISMVAAILWLLLFFPWQVMIQRMKERYVSRQ